MDSGLAGLSPHSTTGFFVVSGQYIVSGGGFAR